MAKKIYKIKRSFVPQSIGNTIKKINRNYTSKYGKIEFIIHSNWPKIVGPYFANYSEPKQISRIRDCENELGELIYKNYLHVSVSSAAALEFQHFKDTIIEKINSYFGYRAIADLRIQQNYIPNIKIPEIQKGYNQKISEKDKINIKNRVGDMKNNELKNSLVNLGMNITKGSK